MSAPLYAIVYVSQAVRPLSDAELTDLLVESRSYNREAGVTGFLAYERADASEAAGTFVQQIEGPEDAVRDVFRMRIQASRRHRDLDVKFEGPIRQRAFEEWTMAFQRRSGVEPEGFDALVERLGPPPA